MYKREIWTFPGSIEVEYKYKGNYGAPGEKRRTKKKATPEQIARQNQWNREKKMRRLIAANFPEGLWITLKYPKGARPSLEQVKKDFKAFIRRVQKAYRDQGDELKYIYRMEIGSRGGIHIHMIVNRTRGRPPADLILQREWKPGRANFENLYERGGYKELASYITKQPDEECEKQLSLFPEEEQKQLCKVGSSRNLIRPQPKVRLYKHWTMRRILRDGPKPHKGYYIDPDSVIQGVNRFTGLSYLQYIEYPLAPPGKGEG